MVFGSFSFQILHVNRLRASESIHELIEKRTLELFNRYFQENGLSKEYFMLIKEESLRKEQINKLEDFILYANHKFKKQLIVIIDDIDETPEADVDESLRYFYGLLECHHICK